MYSANLRTVTASFLAVTAVFTGGAAAGRAFGQCPSGYFARDVTLKGYSIESGIVGGKPVPEVVENPLGKITIRTCVTFPGSR